MHGNSCKVILAHPARFLFDFFFIIIILVSYEEKDLKYKWKSEVESDIYIYDKEMAQFDIISAKRYLKHKVYHSSKNLIPKHLSRNWSK